MEREHAGVIGIGLMLGAAAIWDLVAPETITSAFKRAPLPVKLGSLAIINGHLLGLIPRQVDPFYLALELPGIRRLDVDKGPTVSD